MAEIGDFTCVLPTSTYASRNESYYAPIGSGGGSNTYPPNIIASTIQLGNGAVLPGKVTLLSGQAPNGGEVDFRDQASQYSILNIIGRYNPDAGSSEAVFSQDIGFTNSGLCRFTNFNSVQFDNLQNLRAPQANLTINSINGLPPNYVLPTNLTASTITAYTPTGSGYGFTNVTNETGNGGILLCGSNVTEPAYGLSVQYNGASTKYDFSFDVNSTYATANILGTALKNVAFTNANLQISSINGVAPPALGSSATPFSSGLVFLISGLSDITQMLPTAPSGTSWYVTITPTTLLNPAVCWYSVSSTTSSFTVTLNDAQPATVAFNYTAIAY
jgi:hypothetical protein